MKTRTKLVALLSVLLGGGLLVWPSIYRYDRLGVGKDSQLIRTNRFTGKGQVFSHRGWKVTGERSALSKAEISKLRLDAPELTKDGKFRATLYNGTEKLLESVTVRFVLVDVKGTAVWDRLFRGYPEEVGALPLATSSLEIQLPLEDTSEYITLGRWEGRPVRSMTSPGGVEIEFPRMSLEAQDDLLRAGGLKDWKRPLARVRVRFPHEYDDLSDAQREAALTKRYPLRLIKGELVGARAND